MMKRSIRLFNGREVRAIWDQKRALWWYSAIDIIDALGITSTPRKYWHTLKGRNPQLSSFCGQLKMFAKDGKKYQTEAINAEGQKLLFVILPI